MNVLSFLLRSTAVVLLAASVREAATAAAMLRPRSAVAASPAEFSALPASVRRTTDVPTGDLRAARMSIDVALAPRNAPQLAALLASVYDPNSVAFHHWLRPGEFDARFAPSGAQIAEVAAYLRASGLTVEASGTPFLVRASGPSSAISAAFHVALRTYRNARGIDYFANASPVMLPTRLAAGAFGVIGLSNTLRLHPHLKRALARVSAAPASCEAPFPTRDQIINLYLNNVSYPFGYGDGPGCNGLSPGQENSLYDAPSVGARGRGAGINLAVFELSAYQHSDISIWAKTFFGRAFVPPLVDITIDGGPLTPQCPAGDSCPTASNQFAGDIEVDADIETQLAIAQAANHILVYNAPNDTTGQTSLDEYVRIAADDTADVISTSWGVCENDATAAYDQAENVTFEKMALQGQSLFAAAGDSGAFGCLNDDGTTIVDASDPSTPWVTSVGGTSFESYNPGTNPKPGFHAGVETVWNDAELCNTSADEGGKSGLFWCATSGAGGGGNSQYWGRPFYQYGPEITNPFSTIGNGTTQCSFAATGTACREVPDISADADVNTPYAEFCTASAATPNSACAFPQVPFGWFGVGGTSLAAPLWSGIFADRDSFQGGRSGNANPLLYQFYNQDHRGYFNDVTGIGNNTKTNGLFPTTIGYDLATGIGTPKMGAIITGFPQP